MFFQTVDSVLVDEEPSVKYVYASADSLFTPAGNYANNIIYTEGDILEISTQPGVGVIKISMFVYNELDERIKKRTLTLMEFELF